MLYLMPSGRDVKRVFVVGNSHAGALRLAVKAGWSDPQLQFEFFAIPGRAQPQIEIRDGLLYAAKPAKLSTTMKEALLHGVDLSQFDVVLFSAWGLPGLVEDFGAQRHPLAAARAATWPPSSNDDRPPVSQAVMRELIADALRALHGFDALRQIACVFEGPILVQPRAKPRISAFSAAGAEPPKTRAADTAEFLAALYGVDGAPLHEQFIDVQRQASERIFAAISPRISMLPHPNFENAAYGVPDEFSISATDDHKGPGYGARVLDLFRVELFRRPQPAS
jgi:hypothetical protein